MPSEISIPFRLTANGGFASETNPNRQIRNHVMSLINTSPGERAVLTTYGVPLQDSLFEPGDESVAQLISEQITSAFNTWEPGVVITSVVPANAVNDDNLAIVDVKYQRTDAPDNLAPGRKTNTAIIKIGGEVREVVRG